MRALAGPVTGAPSVGMRTGGLSNLGVYLDAAAAASASFSFLPDLMASAMTPARPRLTLHPGSSTRHWAIFIAHPQVQFWARRIRSTVAFWAGVRPVKSTPGRMAAVFQSWANRSAAPKRQKPATGRMFISLLYLGWGGRRGGGG